MSVKEITPIDNNGTKIYTGDIVAYNQSGKVVLGRVRRIYMSLRNGDRGWAFKVQTIGPDAIYIGGLSTVTSESNLMVILSDGHRVPDAITDAVLNAD